MNNLILLVFCLTLGSFACHRANAQQSASSGAPENPPSTGTAPGSLVAHSTQVASSRPVALNLPVDPKVQQPDKTKVLRIYAGEGYFNVVLAEELRPKLAKGLAAVQIDAVKTIPVRMIVPSKADSRRMVPVPANL